ncbi:hypothetical protein C5167_011648 [Papaver somniferum]|uniref:Uncharacterized protein n=1 Tax=Papaver somniferum TaxID=3469 RepID=A0A4Y7K4W2_PAPSO|nr:hypothetical protein C5167_011648 [Papaver somniferum]
MFQGDFDDGSWILVSDEKAEVNRSGVDQGVRTGSFLPGFSLVVCLCRHSLATILKLSQRVCSINNNDYPIPPMMNHKEIHSNAAVSAQGLELVKVVMVSKVIDVAQIIGIKSHRCYTNV